MDTSNANEGSDSQNNTAIGAALLLVIGEPFSEEHKKLILEEVTKGFRCWDNEATGLDINDELAQIANKADLGEEGPNGERIIRHNSEKLAVEILVNPQTSTVTLAVKNFLATPTTHKQLIYSGHAFQGSGAWILQDDTYTFNNFASAFKDQDVDNALRQQKGSSLYLCTNVGGDWSDGHISKNNFSKILNVSLNPSDKLENVHGVLQFTAYVSNFVRVRELNELLKSTDVIGNIRFSRPTLYIFPGCQGDSALFGISGFNLLVNGGYSRKACFWDFTRHLDRIDAALMTHLGTDNLYGLGSVLQRKSIENVHPEIGFMYINASDKIKAVTDGSEKADKEDSLQVNLAEQGNKLIQYAKQIGQLPHPCTRSQAGQTVDPINLFHKVGIGSLDMYILNPITDSKELKEFYQQWNQKVAQFGTNQHVPLPNTLSVCALLVWRPSDPNDNITRIFFPGNAPQHKVIEGLEKLKTLNILKHPKCTATSLQAKPATKKPTGLAARPPTKARRSPVTTPKSEIVKKEVTPVKAAPKPRPASAPKAKKEDVNKKTSKAEKVKDEKTDKSKSSTSSSPSKSSVRSSAASTPKEARTPTKEPEVIPEPAVQKPIEAAPVVNGGLESSVDPIAAMSAAPLEPVQASKPEPEPVLEAPAPVPEPEPVVAPAGQPAVMDKNKMLELGIYDEDHDIEEDLKNQQNEEMNKGAQMFGGMADSMHEDLIGSGPDIGSGKGMQSSFHGDLMSGSMHEAMFDNNKPFEDQGFVENGCTPVDEVTTPEDDTSEEIQPQALPEPQAYAPASYVQEPDVIPSMPPTKEEPASFEQLDTSSPCEPDLLPVKQDSPDEFSAPQDIGDQSTAPVEPLNEPLENIKQDMPTELETPDEVENALLVDDIKADIEEKDVTEETEKDLAPTQVAQQEPDIGSSVDLEPAVAPAEVPHEDFGVGSAEPAKEDVDKLIDTVKVTEKEPELEPVAAPVETTQEDGEDKIEIEFIPPDDRSCVDLRPGFAPCEPEEPMEVPSEFADPNVCENEALKQEPIEQNDKFTDEPAEDLTSQDFQREQSPEGFLEPEMQGLVQSESPDVADIIERPKTPEPQEIDEIRAEAVQEVQSEPAVEQAPESLPTEPKSQEAPVAEKPESPLPVDDDIVEKVASPQEADMVENDYLAGEENIAPAEQPKVEQTAACFQTTDVMEMPESAEQPKVEHLEEKWQTTDVTDRPETPESSGERADSPDSQADAEHLQRDSLEREEFKEKSPLVESDDQRDSIEREPHAKDSSPEADQRDSIERDVEPKESSPEEDQRDSIERSFEDDETETSEEEETDEDSSSFEQDEEATDEKCLIQDSASEDNKVGQKTDSLAPYDSLLDQQSDNLLTPGSETMLTPESETTDASHGGQVGYHQIDEQRDQDSDEGVESKGAYSAVPQSTNPFGQGFEEVDGSYKSGKMANPFDDMVEQPSGMNPFTGGFGFGQPPAAQQPQDFNRDSSPEDGFGSSGGPNSFNPLSEWGEPMGLPSPPPPEADAKAKASPRPKSASKIGVKKPNGDAKAPEKKSGIATKTAAKPAPKTSNGVPEKSKARPASATANKSTTSTSRLSLGGKTAPGLKTRPASAPSADKAPKSAEKPKANGPRRPGTATGSRASPPAPKMPALPAFNPYYVDLTYIPNHGNPDYSDIEFFKRIRARYYVLSALSPNTQILDALLDAKKTWEDKDLAVTIIPTYDNETLRLWMTLHKDKLADQKVEIAPSASRCTIQLQDHETSSSAYRLEF